VRRNSFSVLALILSSCFSVPSPAQTQPLDDKTFRDLLIQTLTRDLRYFLYWNRERFPAYSPGREVTVATLRNSREYFACIDALNHGIEGLVLAGPRLSTVHRAQWTSGRTNCSEPTSGFRGRTYALTDFEQQRRLIEKAGLPIPEPISVPRETADRNFVEVKFEWELPALEPPPGDSRGSEPRTIEDVRQEVRRVAAKHRAADCGPGEALIPHFSDDDPGLLVWVRLGDHCPDGVVQIIPDTEGRLTLGKLWMSEFDNDAVRRLIEPILLERLPLE